jgi:ABC-type transport system substrate-binding protein
MAARRVDAARFRPHRGYNASLVALVAALVGLVAIGCTSDDPSPAVEAERAASSPGDPNTLRLATVEPIATEPATVVLTDPAGMMALDFLYDGLTTFPDGLSPGADGEAVTMAAAATPDLAASLTPNAELNVWTVTLADRTFSDGSPIRAVDVKTSLERVALPGDASLAGTRLEIIAGYAELVSGAAPEITGLRVVDATTLEVTLLEPYAALPELLASPVYGVSPSPPVDDTAADAAERFVGSGPYHLVTQNGEVTRLERRDDTAEPVGGPPAVEFVQYESWDAAFGGFQQGEVDWSLVPAAAVPGLESTGGDSAFTPLGATFWFGFDLRDERFADPRFRLAIVRAIDSERVVADSELGSTALRAIVPVGAPGAEPSACAGVCDFSPSTARELVAQAFPAGNVPTVAIDIYDDPFQEAMAESVRAQLQEVGIPAEVRVQDVLTFQDFIVTGEQGLFSFGAVGVAPIQDVYLGPPFLSTSRDNVTGLNSAEIDLAIRQARATRDASARQAAYQTVEKQVLAAGVLVPIAQLRNNQVVASRVQGWSSRLDGTVAIAEVSLAS